MLIFLEHIKNLPILDIMGALMQGSQGIFKGRVDTSVLVHIQYLITTRDIQYRAVGEAELSHQSSCKGTYT